MGTLFGFVVGYIVGARMGSRGFDEVVESVRAIRDSQEFQGFVDAVKHHSRYTLQQLSHRLGVPDEPPAA
ncbi:MAG TPA: hypothetical protein VM618_05840 [Acidimicrobiia bacterium]|nr:hypothetical protein [Acidimicrobiia bacterium]